MIFVMAFNDDPYYVEQAKVALTSLLTHNPEAVVLLYLINFKDYTCFEKHKNIQIIPIRSSNITPSSITAYSLLFIYEAMRFYKKPVAWLDTDIIVRGKLGGLFNHLPKEALKVVYRPELDVRSKFNTGVVVVGYSMMTLHLFKIASENALRNTEWFADQLYLYKAYEYLQKKVKLVRLSWKYNDLGGRRASFNDKSLIWHSKRKHFLKEPFRQEYLDVLSRSIF